MSAAQPWMKFYPRDWRADEKLRMCSLAARGLWMEMLALMHGSERYGHLLINGNVPTDAQLAVLAGAPALEVATLLGELETAGVFSRAATGAIYSRRMTTDERKARNARKNGKLGGNPKLWKHGEKSSQDKGEDKDSLKLRGQRPDRTLAGSARAKAKIPLPDNWEPLPFKSGKCKSIIDAWPADRLELDVAKFKAHHRRVGSMWVSWQDAWETWVLNSASFDRPQAQSTDDGFWKHYKSERQAAGSRA